MPNWTSNNVLIHGSPEVLEDFKDFVADRDSISSGNEDIRNPSVFSFQSILPLDQDNCDISENVEHWGTKWDACYSTLQEYSTVLEYSFSTAWCAPGPIISAIQAKYEDSPITIVWSAGGEAYSADDIEPDVWVVVDNLNKVKEILREFESPF